MHRLSEDVPWCPIKGVRQPSATGRRTFKDVIYIDGTQLLVAAQ